MGSGQTEQWPENEASKNQCTWKKVIDHTSSACRFCEAKIRKRGSVVSRAGRKVDKL